MTRTPWPILVFAALVIALLWPVLIGNKILLPGSMLGHFAPWTASVSQPKNIQWDALTWDGIAYFYPARSLLADAIRRFEIPLWNPYQMCGAPFLADGQSAVLYLPNLLFAVMPPDRAFGLLAALHLLGAGAFTYIFLRALGLGRIASTFGGIAFMLSGFAIVWLELPVFLSAGVWLPLALYLSHRAHENRSIYFATGAGVAIALSMLGGHPQIAFYVLLAVAMYWLVMAVSARKEVPVWHSVGLAILTFAVGFALAAPQLLPSAELAELSHRGGVVPTGEGYAAYSRLAMPFTHLILVLAPDFFGNPSRGTFWGPREYAEYCAYVGILTLMLAPLAFGSKGKLRRHARLFGGLAILALLMALGTGVNRAFYFGAPGWARSGSPARVLFLFMFSASVLGALGLERVLREDDRRSVARQVLFSALGILLFGWAMLYLNLNRLPPDIGPLVLRSLGPQVRALGILLLAGVALLLLIASGKLSRPLGGVLIIGVLAADLLVFGVGYNLTSSRSEVYPCARLTRILGAGRDFSRIMPINDNWSLREFPDAVLPPNSASVYRLFDVQGYDSLYPVRYKALLDAAAGGRDSSPRENGNMLFARNPDSPVYDLLGVRWFVSTRPFREGQKAIDGCYLRGNPDAFPRAFIVHAIEYAEDQDALRKIAEGETDLRCVALISFEDAKHLKLYPDNAEYKARVDSAVITDYAFNRVRLKASAVRSGLLVLADQYYHGWKAFVDGREKPVIRVDYALRGVPIPSGRCEVVFRYDPASYKTGLKVAGGALLLILLLAARLLVQRRLRRTERQSDVT